MKLSLIFLLLWGLISCANVEKKTKPMSLIERHELSTDSVLVNVQGMVCDYCVNGLKEEFTPKAAVESVEVNLASGFMLITLKPGQTLTDTEIKHSVAIKGLRAVSISKK